jgi:predicted phosphoribosyltransferase
MLKTEVDEVICAITPEPFHAVGLWYEDFSQTTDEEVRELLAQSANANRAAEDVSAREQPKESDHGKHN